MKDLYDPVQSPHGLSHHCVNRPYFHMNGSPPGPGCDHIGRRGDPHVRKDAGLPLSPHPRRGSAGGWNPSG
jgi:hypothetical protein